MEKGRRVKNGGAFTRLCIFFGVVLGMELMASCMLGKYSTAKLQPQVVAVIQTLSLGNGLTL